MPPPRLAVILALAPWVAACSESDDVVYTAERVVVYEDGAVPTTTVASPVAPVVIERIWSPLPATAELLGVGAVADDPVTVDGEPADVVGFDVDAAGSFTLRVRITTAGAHEVCVRDECGRVFVEPEQ